MAKTAQQMADAYKQAMQSPTTAQRYKDGIAGYNGNPMAAAAQPDAQQRYAQNTQAAVASGKMAAKLNAVPVQTWKDNAMNVGAARLTSGAQKAMSKVQAHFSKWAPIYQQCSDAVKNMPKGGIANATARVQAVLQILMSNAGSA